MPLMPTLTSMLRRIVIALRQRALHRWLIGLLFLAAGISHFADTETYISYMPGYLPWHRELVYVAGGALILGSLLLPFRPTRRWAGIWLIGFLLAVLPANIEIVRNNLAVDPDPVWVVGSMLRVGLQGVLVWWVAWAAEASLKPWRRRQRIATL